MDENVYIKVKDGEATVLGSSSDVICVLVDMLAAVLCAHAEEHQMSPEELHAKVSVQLYKQLIKKDAAEIDVRDIQSEEDYEYERMLAETEE
mgnify:CR=1 FL=1